MFKDFTKFQKKVKLLWLVGVLKSRTCFSFQVKEDLKSPKNY